MQKTKRKIKKAKNEVSRLTRELSAPLESNIESCEDLQTMILRLGMEIEEGKVRVNEK